MSAIIEANSISKGTFYHYFESKEDLLNCLVDRITDQVTEEISRALAVEGLDAITRLNTLFITSSRWKAANREALMAIVKPMFAEENLRMRRKMSERSTAVVKPMIESIIRQGVAEGAFHTEYPEETAELIFRLGDGVRDGAATLLLEMDEKPGNWDAILRWLDCYQVSVERILGAPAGSLKLADPASVEAMRPRGV